MLLLGSASQQIMFWPNFIEGVRFGFEIVDHFLKSCPILEPTAPIRLDSENSHLENREPGKIAQNSYPESLQWGRPILGPSPTG